MGKSHQNTGGIYPHPLDAQRAAERTNVSLYARSMLLLFSGKRKEQATCSRPPSRSEQPVISSKASPLPIPTAAMHGLMKTSQMEQMVRAVPSDRLQWSILRGGLFVTAALWGLSHGVS